MDALWTSLTTKLAELEINLEDVNDGDWHEVLTEQGFGATDRARLLNRIRRQNTRSPTADKKLVCSDVFVVGSVCSCFLLNLL